MTNERFSVTGLVGISPPHVREWARNVGREFPDREWLLTEYDSWERNPFYRGEPGPHPEDDREDEEGDSK